MNAEIKKPLVYAVVPARSGSKGMPNKNIKPLAGRPLASYTLAFARKLAVDRVIFSTDSEAYAQVARDMGVEVPFLRGAAAANDTAMEEDVLNDLHSALPRHGWELPDLWVWLRPTFVFHDLAAVTRCIERMMSDSTLSACRTVCAAERRLYVDREGLLAASFPDEGRSMVRRQELPKAYKVFSTDVFRRQAAPVGSSFLGDKVGYEEIGKICGFDIDDAADFAICELLIEHRKELIGEHLH